MIFFDPTPHVDVAIDVAVLLTPVPTTWNRQLTTPKFCASFGGSS
jgi:hypothetical protein